MPERVLSDLRRLSSIAELLTDALRWALWGMALADLTLATLLATLGVGALNATVLATNLGWLAPWQWALLLGIAATLVVTRYTRVAGALAAGLWYAIWLTALLLSGAPLYVLGLYGQIVFVHILAPICWWQVNRRNRELS